MASPVMESPVLRSVPGTTALVPIPPSAAAIDLPADQYLHQGAPTEWWWHTGTLQSGDRIFGFEINAASFEGKDPPFGFTQIMLSDVSNNVHYQNTTPFAPPWMFEGIFWAQSDPTKDWSVQMGNTKNWLSAIQLVDPGSGYTSAPTVTISGGGGAGASSYPPMLAADGTIEEIFLYSAGKGYTSAPTVTISGGGGSGATARALNTYVTMNAAWGDPTQNMAVKALLNDQHTGTEIVFDLTMSQQGPPFLVWGTGVAPVPGTSGDHLHTNNYYYSLTRLQTTGTISIGGEVLPVVGMTWMDHEYGAFGQSQGTTPKWILQDMQLDNGVHISNSISLTETPAPGSTIPSHATVQRADGTTYFVPSTISLGSPWTSPWTQKTYYRELLVVIPAFFAKITVTSLMDDQEFPATQSPVYEGIASAIGTFEGQAVSGYGWNEQAPL